MRVLIIGKCYPAARGTRALQMAKVAEALRNAGMNIRMIPGPASDRAPTAATPGSAGPFPPDGAVDLTVRSSSNAACRLTSRVRIELGKLYARATCAQNLAELAKTAIREDSPDIVMTVAVPVLFHRVGLRIKRAFPDLPWVAFYSDPRPLEMLPKPFRRHTLQVHRKKRLNRTILQRADAVVAPNKYMFDVMEQRLAVSLADRRYVVPHCGSAATTPTDRRDLAGWIVHVGSLGKNQVSRDLLHAIRNVARKYPRQFKGLMCVGKVADEILALFRSLNLADYVKLVGVVSPEKASAIAGASDVNLLVDTPLEVGFFLHSKFADYAVNGRPILVVGPEKNPMRDYLERYGGGMCVSHRQAEIESALERLFVREKHNGSNGRDVPGQAGTALAQPFLPDNVAHQYLKVFRRVSGEAPLRQPPGRRSWPSSGG
jgi:glycosyltransferase involved in cell wall biosynthesis